MASSSQNIVIKPIGNLVAALQQYGQDLYKPPPDTIRGIEPGKWPSPYQPIKPIAPDGTQPLAFQFWESQNLTWTPRPDAEYTAQDLKAFATYPLARICIENVKDALAKASWEIQPKLQLGENRKQAMKRAKGDPNILKLSRFFEYPDREHSWSEWVRPLLDDLLVIDAPAVLVRKTYSGVLAELRVMRGEMFSRYIDAQGFTPAAPDPAYAQNWWGIPLVNLSMDELVYKPRNIVPRNTVSSQLYGMSPTEQLAPEIEIGMQRLAFILAYYKFGSVPDVLQVVPPGISPELLKETMQWMNSDLAGNLAKRRQIRLMQGFAPDGKDQILFPKEKLLSDPFDEMHMKKIAFGYGTSPQRLAKQVNRAQSQQMDESADVEGTLPYFIWLKSAMIDWIINRVFMLPDYEMIFNPYSEPDPEKQGKTITGYVDDGLLTPNEGRERMGEEPANDPGADELGLKTGTGRVTFAQSDEAHQQTMETQSAAAEAAKNPPEDKGAAKPDGKDKKDDKPKTNGKDDTAKWAHCGVHKIFVGTCAGCREAVVKSFVNEKAYREAVQKASSEKSAKVIHPGRLHPHSILARQKVDKILRDHFRTMNRKTTKELAKQLGLAHRHIQKKKVLLKAADEQEALDAILRSLKQEFQSIPDEVLAPLAESALAGAANGSLQLNITSEDMLGKINETAQAWASKRAAELVGMRRNEDGELVPNPNAKWAITDTTRDKLQSIIEDLFGEETVTLADVEERLQEAGIFSDTRATMIARTEITRAQVQGNLESWRRSGLVDKVNWQLSSLHDKDDVCTELADGSPYELEDVPDFPAHPNCECTIVLSEIGGEE